MFKHGDPKGPDAGQNIREGIRAKACTFVRTYTVFAAVGWQVSTGLVIGDWLGRWHHSRARIRDWLGRWCHS